MRVTDLEATLVQILEAVTSQTEQKVSKPEATKKTKRTTKKSNGNKWLAKLNGAKVWKEMKDQGSSVKNKARFAELRAEGVPLMLQKADGSTVTWNLPS